MRVASLSSWVDVLDTHFRHLKANLFISNLQAMPCEPGLCLVPGASGTRIATLVVTIRAYLRR